MSSNFMRAIIISLIILTIAIFYLLMKIFIHIINSIVSDRYENKKKIMWLDNVGSINQCYLNKMKSYFFLFSWITSFWKKKIQVENRSDEQDKWSKKYLYICWWKYTWLWRRVHLFNILLLTCLFFLVLWSCHQNMEHFDIYIFYESNHVNTMNRNTNIKCKADKWYPKYRRWYWKPRTVKIRNKITM